MAKNGPLNTFGGVAERLKSLAHPARLRILQILAHRGACSCGEIVSELPLAQATVSQHLKILREHGFVAGESLGNSVSYSIDQPKLRTFCNEFEKLFGDVWSLCCSPKGKRKND